MSINKQQKSFLTICIFFLIHSFTFGQINDSLVIENDSLAIIFEKVILDGNIAYRNKNTNMFISQEDYEELLKIPVQDTLIAKNYIESEFSTAFWYNDKVNPYSSSGIKLASPFKIEFDQLTFTHPVDGDIDITSRFGKRQRGPHRGLDIDLVTGDKVRSVLPGKVRFVGYSRGHGKTVVVRHANEIETVYAHLSAYKVKVNDIVNEGQVLGLGGNTGNSRGSHLHLEVRYKGVCIHPEYVFNFDGSQSIRGAELWVTNNYRSTRGHSSYRKSNITPLLTEQDAIAAQNAEPKYYRVRKGDTLSHIARKYSLNVGEICSLNSISRYSTLRIGQIVKVR